MNAIDKQYQQLLQSIIDYGVEKKDRTGTGTKSIFGYTIRHNMKDGFPLLTTKKMAWNSIVTELLWFLRGDTNIKFLLDYDCHIWDGDAWANYKKKTSDKFKKESDISGHVITNKEDFIKKIKTDDSFAKEWGELGPIYGKQWRNWETYEKWETDFIGTYRNSESIDQIANLISELKTNPDSRRLMVNAWNVGELDQMVLPPCHYGFQVYTRELTIEERVKIYENSGYIKNIDPLDYIPKRAISLMWNQRSVDTFLGLPFNIASYGLLLMLLGKLTNMIPDQLVGNLGDTHLYLNHIEQAKEQISRTPFNLPEIKITERNWYQHEKVKEYLGEESLDRKILSFRPDCFELINYQCHPKIKAPLSN